MAISLYVQSYTSTTVTVFAMGTNINYSYKKFQIYIDGYMWSVAIQSGNQFTIENLEPNTSYDLYINAYYENGGWIFDGTSNTITISTSGGSNLPTYILTPQSNNGILIQVYNASSECQIYTYLYDSPSSTSYIDSHHRNGANDTYSNLADGTYYIEVDYRDNNITSWTPLQNYNTGQTRSLIEIGGGGGLVPTYTAYESSGSLIIAVINAEANCLIRTFLFDDPNAGPTDYIDSHSAQYASQDSYTGLTNGTYYVQIEYRDSEITTWTLLENDVTGQTRTQVQITGGGPTPSTGGYIYIYTNQGWRRAKPYIYTNQGWQAATPYIYTGSTWRKTE